MNFPGEAIRVPQGDADEATAVELFGRLAASARKASRALMQASADIRTEAILAVSDTLRRDAETILGANRGDVEAFRGPDPMRDRLALDPDRIESMACGLEEVARQPDPVGRVMDAWTRPNGLRIEQVAAPIGVIGMIYESRPNVGVDAAGLCIRSGNALILRGGGDSLATATALHRSVAAGLAAAGLPDGCVQIVPTRSRAIVGAMLAGAGQLDLLIPRGGKSLVERVRREARVPVLSHADGVCHTYIHRDADPAMALDVLVNAKLRRVSVCGATETLLIDAAIAPAWLPDGLRELAALGCQFRGDARVREICPDVPAATEDDFRTEWQDAVLSVAVVDDVDQAIAHIARYGSGHTDAILTGNEAAARHFLREVDSAVTLWNASTQFSDGAEFGFGAEIGISTGRLHSRGPIGAGQLVTRRFQVIGDGQVRR